MARITVERVTSRQPPETRPLAARLRLGSAQQHVLLTDTTAGNFGNDIGPDAHDFYDAALASCKVLTLLWYARKKGLPVGDVQAVIESDNSREREGIYTLSARLTISGDLSDAQLRELQSVAEKCPVHKLMTKVTTEIRTTVERA